MTKKKFDLSTMTPAEIRANRDAIHRQITGDDGPTAAEIRESVRKQIERMHAATPPGTATEVRELGQKTLDEIFKNFAATIAAEQAAAEVVEQAAAEAAEKAKNEFQRTAEYPRGNSAATN